jgi:HrpA-like RNA helicase
MRWACALPLSLCGGSRPCAARAGAPRAPPLHRVYVGCHPRRAQARWRTPRLLRRAATDGADGASVETRASTASDSPAEQRLAELLAELPVGEVVDELLQALERAPNAVLEAAPGAGKTTCLPLAILQRAKWLPEGHTILV